MRPSSNPEAPAELETRLREASATPQRYVLRLFVTGNSTKSSMAIQHVRRLCDQYLAGRCELEIIDIYQQPDEARGEKLLALPTLIRQLPEPSRKMIGDFSDSDRVLLGLDLLPVTESNDANR